ncbi:MAG: phosphate ABC transporter permease subunit PstC [Bacteroidales bacterium]|nr:phosphate ABC transporter permease subunit PstC [Bacteroidales bacterium]
MTAGNRILKDRVAHGGMLAMTIVGVLLVAVIAAGLYLKSRAVLDSTSLWTLLCGSEWRPMQGKFGFLPFLAGTLWVTMLSIALALPVSLLTALFLTEYARPVVRKCVFPLLDILAALPSVIYGVWGVLVVVPWISRRLAPLFVDFSTGYTVLAAGIVLGVMVVPLLVSLFIEVFSTIPKELREASLALGATRWQTAWKVVCRKTLPGIMASTVLAISRALGETIAVLMVCGCVIGIPRGVLEPCYPIPALIANNYGEMLSMPLYESALMFAALLLFAVVLVFNLASRIVLNRIGCDNS